MEWNTKSGFWLDARDVLRQCHHIPVLIMQPALSERGTIRRIESLCMCTCGGCETVQNVVHPRPIVQAETRLGRTRGASTSLATLCSELSLEVPVARVGVYEQGFRPAGTGGR